MRPHTPSLVVQLPAVCAQSRPACPYDNTTRAAKVQWRRPSLPSCGLSPPFSRGRNFFFIPSLRIHSDRCPKLSRENRYDRGGHSRKSFLQGAGPCSAAARLMLLKCFSHRRNGSGSLLGCLATTIADPALLIFTVCAKD